MATMMRCLAQLSLAGPWGTVLLWPGLEVDVDRELAPGVTVADAVQGREDCFEPVVEPVAAEESPIGAAAEEPAIRKRGTSRPATTDAPREG